MQSGEDSNKRRQTPKIPAYLSEFDSHDSSSISRKPGRYQSANMMRKLKQLWDKQKFLTDDQYQPCKEAKAPQFIQDSSMDYQVDELINASEKNKNGNFQRKTQHRTIQARKHQRIVSSSDQQLSTPQKMKKNQDSKQQVRTKENVSMKQKVQELASISSAFQDQSLQIQTP